MRSGINSRIIVGSASNYNQLNHIFRGFLDSARWLPKRTATAQEALLYQQILDLFVPPWTVCSTGSIRDLNFKLSDRAPPCIIALAEGPYYLRLVRPTRWGTTAFDLTRPGNRTLAIGLAHAWKEDQFAIFSHHKRTSEASIGDSFTVTKLLVIGASCFFFFYS